MTVPVPSTISRTERVVADEEFAGPHRLLEMRAIRDIEADRRGVAGAGDAPVRGGDRDAPGPGKSDGEIGEKASAGFAGAGERRERARHHLQEGTRRRDQLALLVGAASCQLQRLPGGGLDALAAGGLHVVYAVEQQRHDREQGKHGQAAANAPCAPDGSAGPLEPLALVRDLVGAVLHCAATLRRAA
jgi:hypothetical protein